MRPTVQHAATRVLDVAFERHGDPTGFPVVLLHGFPYDPRGYDEVAARLAAQGADVVVPYLRGYGPTRFRSASTLRSGQQGALATDLHELVHALGLHRPILVGFDWGGRAACVASLAWPEEVGGLVTVGGYNTHDVADMSSVPDEPAVEAMNWYQFYFHSERGRAGLHRFRRELTRKLWRDWSPAWGFDDATFEASAASFDNPDFVDVVVHSYRVRYGLAPGDPAYDDLEALVAAQPSIEVPTIVVDPTADPLEEPRPRHVHEAHFSRLVDHRLSDSGHNTPCEDPGTVTDAVLALRAVVADGGSGPRR